MNVTKNARQTNRLLVNKNNRLRSIEASVVESQVAKTPPAEANRKPAPGSRQREKNTLASKQLTVIQARIDVGFGNSLFIRGRGAELAWDKGLPLTCTDASTWTWSTEQAKDKLVFKLLLNDQVWARGDDVIVEAGRKIELAPTF